MFKDKQGLRFGAELLHVVTYVFFTVQSKRAHIDRWLEASYRP
jgi:hypothetical protein